MKKYNELIAIVLVSYYSDELVKKFLKQIPSNYKVLITDNTNSNILKNDIENAFDNVKVFIPKINLGNGGGINFALKKSNTKYVLYFDLDIEIEEDTIEKLIVIAESINDWGILAPNLKDYNYDQNFFLDNKSSKKITSMNFVEGCALLFNIQKLKKIGFFDEKIFLYYEENDLFFRCIKNNFRILLCKNIYIRHFGNSSIDKKYQIEIELNRNWHYMWSKFYYYKKNYSYLRGLKETFLQFIKAAFKSSFFYFINRKKFLIYKNRLSGLFNSYLNKPSWKRPNIK